MTLARRHLILVALVSAVVLTNFAAIRALVDLSLRDMTASHLVAVPFVTVFLIWQERSRVFSSARSAVPAGAALMLAGLAFWWAGSPSGPASQAADVLSIQVAAVVALLLGGFLAIYGPDTFKRAIFPLAFLLFTIPIPHAVLDGTTLALKRGSTEMTAVLFDVVRTPYLREGYVFTLPTLTIEVADACSGIRSTIALVLTVLLADYMFLSKAWTRTLLMLAILPVTLFKNAVRIVALSLLTMYVDPGFIKGQLHHDGGIVFFLIGLAMLSPVLAVLRKAEAQRVEPRLATSVQA